MENPATWGPAEQIINRVLQEHNAEPFKLGLSLPRQIADALRQAGLLTEKGDNRP